MPGPSSNASFIPKRGATTRSKKTRGGKVYLLTVISYLLIIATLLASLGVFFYKNYVKKQLQDEITIMNDEIGNFDQADMERVQEFDTRLKRAQHRLDNSVSVTSIFKALEDATVNSVSVKNLVLERNGDENYILQASVETDDFDSSLFQRGVYERNDTISNIEIDGLTIGSEAAGDETTVKKTVSFTAYLAIPVSSVPYQPRQTVVTQTPIPVIEDVTSTSSDVSDDETANQTESI